MKVFTPGSVANHTGSKYLGVLVAAKYARNLNEFRRGEVYTEPASGQIEPREKLTTTALGGVASGTVEFNLIERLRGEM
ncbi:MAG: DNA-directed RNA polymerase subunit omega [Gemmatimonadetes bacterium]|nr:DNA-directed RNA polymerase subunit omega [Gemmatimonadota bacterium]